MNPLWSSIIAAISGLLGALIGGYITSHNQTKQRRYNRMSEQIDGFYAPLLGLRMQILAKSETRLKMYGATGRAWIELMVRTDSLKVEDKIKLEEEHFPVYERAVEEGNRELIEKIIPLYREMIKHFEANVGLAKPTTLNYFGALVEFVEIWDQWLNKTIPKDALKFLGHSEDNLKPFYQDLSMHLNSLNCELNRT